MREKIDLISLLIENITLMNKEKNIIEEKNINFFSANKKYQQNVATLDTYKILYNEITNTLKNSKKLLDIGHGGSFDYDT